MLEALDADWEIICVDDGSRDGSLERLLELARTNTRIKVLQLTRNFGKESALTAGLEASSGDVVVPIDADLQDPPTLIAVMLDKWRKGYDIVYAATGISVTPLIRSSRRRDYSRRPLTPPGKRFRTTAVHVKHLS